MATDPSRSLTSRAWMGAAVLALALTGTLSACGGDEAEPYTPYEAADATDGSGPEDGKGKGEAKNKGERDSGKDDDDDSAEEPASSDSDQSDTESKPRSGARMVSWADDVCSSVASDTDELDTPTLDPDDPNAFLAALADMFGTMADGMTEQVNGLKEVGPPPAKATRKAYRDALQHAIDAAQVARDSQKLANEVDVANPQEFQDLVGRMSMKVNGEPYLGLVRDLHRSHKELRVALEEAPDCDRYGI